MKIKITDRNECEECTSVLCTFKSETILPNYYSLRTESTVCPVGYLNQKPIILVEENYLDTSKCINCCLCVKDCIMGNLAIEDYKYNAVFDNLSGLQYNAIALSYLHLIFGFAANTNRNGSIDFDGYFQLPSKNFEGFVEVDYYNDSLESCRRLLGDFLTYRGQLSEEVNYGLIVLKDFPSETSRDVYNLISKIKEFPKTSNKEIGLTTFSLLRKFALASHNILFPKQLFFNPMNESLSDYKKRIAEAYDIDVKLI